MAMSYLELMRQREHEGPHMPAKSPGDAHSQVGETVRDKRDKREKTSSEAEPSNLDEIRAFIAEMPRTEQWNLEETVAHILALTEAERAVYYAALIHDWRAWRAAMARFGQSKETA
jgi:hypothetical protein